MTDIDVGKFGKNSGVDLNSFKSGLKKDKLQSAEQKSIFDAIDTDKNGVIDDAEVNNFKTKLDKSDDNVVTNKEAKKFLKENNLKNIDKKELLKFLKSYTDNTENVQDVKVSGEGEQKTVQITYKDGTKETINPDKSSSLTQTDKDGVTTTKFFDENKKLKKDKVKTTEGDVVETEYAADEKTPEKTVTTTKDGAVSTVVYNAGKPSAKQVKSGVTTSNYTYDNDGNEVLNSKIENEGIPTKEKKTEYTYNEDGTVTEHINQNGKLSSKTSSENGIEETTTDANGNPTVNKYSNDGKKLSQTKTVDGTEYSVDYDGNGNTKVIIQNGETVDALAKKFGCTKEALLEANGGKIRGWAGDDVVVPGELEADDKRLQGRQSKEEAIEAYKKVAQEIQDVKDEAAARKPITFTNKDYDNYEQLAKALFKREGNESPSKRQMQTRIADLKKTNPDLKDGELKGKKITANVSPDMSERISDKAKDAKEYKENLKTRKEAETIANKLYQICDDKAGATDSHAFYAEMRKINPKNVVAVLDSYDKVIVKNPGDTSLMDTICSEVGASAFSKRKALNQIMDNLALAAKEAGVSDSDIEKAKKDYQTSIDKEFGALLRRTNTKDMEKAVDFLRGAIVAKKTGNVENMTEAEAIAAFNADFESADAEAQKSYSDARKEEGWTARVGDTVCGWFGCNTIEEMDAKLGKNAADVKKLAAASKDEAEFKKVYKEVFGVEFDANKIAARDAAKSNYQQAANLSSSINITSGILKKSDSLNYSGLRNEIKDKFQLDDETVDSIISNYSQTLGRKISSDNDKKEMLTRFLEETQNASTAEYRKLTKGKTVEQMGHDLELLTKSAFGTNDIVKDVMQFNENQQTTEMITDAAFEVAGTIALQFVPGLGQMAAARLALSAAKWGTKAVKIANAAVKAEKAFAAVKKFQQGEAFVAKAAQGARGIKVAKYANKAAQVGTQMANSGAATVAVEASSGKDAKTVMRKTLMNMSFAGVGAGSSLAVQSRLATNIMKNFHLQDSALAKEIAEEIINAAGSYGVTKAAGDNYGSQDAFIDIATGILIARASHIKAGKSHNHVDPNHPGVDPNHPGIDPNHPGIDPNHPGIDPNHPGVDPNHPGIDPNHPGVDPNHPGVDPNHPGIDPNKPGVDPNKPGVDPNKPGVDPNKPGVDPNKPGVDPENPIGGPGKKTGVDPENPAGGPGSKPIIRELPTPSSQIKTIDEMKKFLVEHNVSTFYAEKLMKLKNRKSTRFDKLVNSGVFDLIKDRRINASILDNIEGNRFLSKKTLRDIKKMKNQESVVSPLPRNTNPNTISQHVDNGEVCTIGGKLYVNDNGKPVEINLTKEKFEELFPTLSRVDLSQGSLGDCWLVSSLDNLMDLPVGRTSIYKLFRQEGNDIYIKFPDSDKSVKFSNGQVLDAKGKQITGAQGLKMVEQAYAVHRFNDYSQYSNITDIASFSDVQTLMEKLHGGTANDALSSVIGKSKTYTSRIDQSTPNCRAEQMNLIKRYANDENALLNLGTKENGSGAESLLEKQYDLYSTHAYAIKGYNEKTGMVYITNPWHASVITEVPVDVLLDNVRHVSVTVPTVEVNVSPMTKTRVRHQDNALPVSELDGMAAPSDVDFTKSENLQKRFAYYDRKSRFAGYSDSMKTVYTDLGTRIQNGEIPSKEMLEKVVDNAIKNTDIDKETFMEALLVDIDDTREWRPLSYSFKRPEAVISNNSDRLKADVDSFKERNGLNSQTKPDVNAGGVQPPKRFGLGGSEGDFFTAEELKFISTKFSNSSKQMQDAIPEVLNEIGQKIQAGEMPSLELVRPEILNAAKKYGISAGQLEEKVYTCIESFDEWKPIAKPLGRRAGNLDAAKVEEQTKLFKESKNLTEEKAKIAADNKAKVEAEIKAKAEAEAAELKAKEDARLKAEAEFKQKYAEKYPDVINDDVPFRQGIDTQTKLVNLMEELGTSGLKPFDQQEIYSKIYSAGITNDADMDLALDLIKKRFYGDVIAEEVRVSGLKDKYKFFSDSSITDSDKVISRIKEKQAAGEKISMDEVDDIIQDTFYENNGDLRDIEKVKKRIFEDSDINQYLNDNTHMDVWNNNDYRQMFSDEEITEATKILDSLIDDVNNGKELTKDLINSYIDNRRYSLSEELLEKLLKDNHKLADMYNSL